MPFVKLWAGFTGAILTLWLVGCAPTALSPARPAASSAVLSVVPRPRMLHIGSGGFPWPQHLVIAASSPQERGVAATLAQFAVDEGPSATVSRSTSAAISLHILQHIDSRLGTEGYALRINSRGIVVQANAPAGLFYGVQTLEQLSEQRRIGLYTRSASILDWPALRWRGIHLDVSRHFFAVSVIKRYIDLAARYKLNVFHWHLTDDQAWRLQITRFPRLAATDGAYTQAQVRELVAYAGARFVMIVPEIEMPGHSSAALRAYPELNCAGSYCENTRTIAFVEDVLREVFALFPGPYVHLGGDEVTYTPERARFMRTIEQFARAHGRRVVAWDDVLHAGLSRSAAIMAWHGERGAIAAMASGYDTVMTPDGPLYFDAYQGNKSEEPRATRHMSTLDQVYAYDPLPDAAPANARAHLLGVQGNVWTEHIATSSHLFYMVLPRELALAEIAWLPARRKDWAKFLDALPAQFAWLDRNHYPYRVPNAIFEVAAIPVAFVAVPGNVQAAMALTPESHATIRIRVPLQGAQIRYTTDGSVPASGSPQFQNALRLELPRGARVTLRAAVFAANGRMSAVSQCIIQRVTRERFRAVRTYSRSWAGLVSP